ncbi:unnamed protein product [marine sediment metagenome]|jgi:hypothetical protein|uniref:Uncharacterized protein n=1 Tax=marine sediment metagenome TaxID=412755 RepID=X1KK77_9ZZZZ
MKSSIIFNTICLTAIMMLLPALLHAQPSFSDDVVDAPVDGGLSLLIAGGIGYGMKKVREKRKK